MLALLALTTAACGSDAVSAGGAATTVATPATTAVIDAPGDIVATALTSGVFTTLAGAVVTANLVETLRGPGPFTVFAPTDAAFAKLPAPVLSAVQDDKALLTTVLTYHVLAGSYTAETLPTGQVKTVAGAEITVTKSGTDVFINGNRIAKADVKTSNGMIHVMSDVLVPPIGDIIKVATTLPGFGTLAKLVTQADLVKTLQSAGPFTVFAPTDDAFKAVPSATLSAVAADNKLLTTVLTYHVVAGKLSTSDLKPGKLKTVAGVELTITKDADGNTLVNGKKIAVANVEATNGIIQVMGDVLIPPS